MKELRPKPTPGAFGKCRAKNSFDLTERRTKLGPVKKRKKAKR